MSTPTLRGDDLPSVRKRPRLSDELVEEQVTNVARSDSFSDGFFGSDIDFDDETMQMVDEYDVLQPEIDVTCVANSGDDPFLDGADGSPGTEEEEEEIPSSQGEADAIGLYTVGDIHGDCPPSSQSPLRNASPSVGAFKRTSSRQLKNLGPPVPAPLFPSKSPSPSKRLVHIAGIDDDDLEKESDIDFGAYVSPIPAAVGFASAAAVLADPDIPTFMPASQVPIDRSELTFTGTGLKPAIKSTIKLAGGGGAIKPISVEAIKASADKLMSYQQDTHWKPQTRLRTMLPPAKPSGTPVPEIAEPSREPVESIRKPIEPVLPLEDEEKESDIDFSALINPTIGFTSASANITYDDSMPTFMPASQVPIDRSELASVGTSLKPLTKSEIQLAGGAGGLKPLTEEEIKASVEKLMLYQQDTKWRPQTRLRVPRLALNAKPISTPQAGDLSTPELDSVGLDDSGVGLLEPVGSELLESVGGTKGKGKQRAITPPPEPVPNLMSSSSILRSMENLRDTRSIDNIDSVSQPASAALRPNAGPAAPQREPENPFSARAQLAATPIHRSIAAFKTPIRPTSTSRPSAEFPSESIIQTPLFSQATPPAPTPSLSQAGPSTLYRLGLSQRKPKTKAPAFTTPFKRGMAPGEKGREMLDLKNRGTPSRTGARIAGLPTPVKVNTPGGSGKIGVNGSGTSTIARALEAEKQRQMLERAVFDTRRSPGRKGLREAGVVPLSGGQTGSSVPGLNIPYLTLKSAGNFSFPQGGHAAMLAVLREHGCTLAEKEWVQNHWAQVVWKLSGLARINSEETKGKWSWEEASRQMLYRYEREINRAERPAIRQIQEHDASAARAMVLCVSDVQLREKDEVEIELTDGWYRIRTVSDKALARAVKKGKLVVGRKLAVAGARLEGGHEGKEVLQAYHSSVLKIGGNSTSLAPWDARLGFQLRPYIASLRSLTSDGGTVPLLEVEVMKLFPVGFVETDQMGRSSPPCDQSGEDEAQRAWENHRTNEASKWRIQFEKQLERMRAIVDRLSNMAKGFSLNPDSSPPDDTEDFLESLEDAEYDLEVLKARKFAPASAAWLVDAIRTKCDEQHEKREEEMERELANTCPPRKVRNFRVVVIKDACTLRKPTSRTAQLTAWDVLGFGNDSLKIGQRYLLSGCTPEAKYFIDRELHPKAIRYGPNVVEALRLLSPDDEVEGQQALSIIGALDQIDNAIWDAGEPGGYTPTVEEALALPESNIRVLHGCSMGCLFESGYCDGPAGFGSGAFVSFGCCFYVITNMLPILEAATGGRVPPRRLWELAMSRGCLEPHSSYGLPRVDYGPTIDYMVHDPCLFGTLTTEFGTLNTKALASLEEIGNPNDIADVIRDRGFWMWMRPDRFPIGSSTCASTSTTVVRPVEFMSKASIMNLPLELLHSVALQLPLSSITTLARINRTMYHQFLQARDALAKVYMRMQARWCLPFGEAERRWWDERNGDDALGWDYLKRCCSESYSMRNRRRIWRTAESIEEECEREEAKRANEDCVASI